MKGKQIKTLEDLHDVAMRKRSIIMNQEGNYFFHFGFKRPKPAAFVMSMQARTVMFMLIAGMYEWIPEGRKKNKSPWEKKTDEWKRRQKQNGQP